MIKLSSVGGNRLCLPEFSDQIVQNVSLCFIFYLNLYVILSSLKQAKGSNLKAGGSSLRCVSQPVAAQPGNPVL